MVSTAEQAPEADWAVSGPFVVEGFGSSLLKTNLNGH